MTEKKARTAKTYKSTPEQGKDTPPWKKKNPNKTKASKTKLTAAQIEEAKARAKKAGRPYPNLVDNMAVARKSAQSSKK